MGILGTILGTNEYTIKIKWEDTGKRKIVTLKERTETRAIIKLSKKYDVTDKATMTVRSKN